MFLASMADLGRRPPRALFKAPSPQGDYSNLIYVIISDGYQSHGNRQDKTGQEKGKKIYRILSWCLTVTENPKIATGARSAAVGSDSYPVGRWLRRSLSQNERRLHVSFESVCNTFGQTSESTDPVHVVLLFYKFD
jgi:hypothetical protein